jgi:hypothetical protein
MSKTSRFIHKEEKVIEHELETHPFLVKVLIFLAFAIPVAILAYVFYVNYLPFGYSETYELTIDEEGLINPISNEIYITNTNGRKLLSLPEGVNGQVNVVIEPNVVLENAQVNISLEGDEGVYLGTPLKVDLDSYDWDYVWDFTQGIQDDLEGTAEYNPEEGCAYFDATKEQTLFLPNSSDMFEEGPMSIYVKWKPSDTSQILGNYQQLLGHYNWEIWQGANNIKFQVGRMNDENGSIYSLSYPIEENFFNNEHELLAIYNPDNETGKGHIELFIDNKIGGRIQISNETIYEDYNSNKDLSLGWTPHSYQANPYYDGCIYEIKILEQPIQEKQIRDSLFISEGEEILIPVMGKGYLNSISIDLIQ